MKPSEPMIERAGEPMSQRAGEPTSGKLLALLAVEAATRRRAVESFDAAELGERAVGYALRRLLATDGDVSVRAAAAEAMGRRGAGLEALVGGLLGALDDVSPVVRDAAIRALARRREVQALPFLRERVGGDAVWWVRRAAIYALGVIGSASGDQRCEALVIETARAALADPFWRVRHAAVQVLAVSGNRTPERREEILAKVEGGSADYLRALWGPTLVEDPRAPAVASRLPEPLCDRDPAVVTARLATMEAPPSLALVELLCDPHQPLRELAVERLIESGDAEAFLAALRWLDEPRIPHVAATVIEMLDGLGDPARALAASVLAAPARPGASRWAIGWVVASCDEELATAAWQRTQAMGEEELALLLAPLEALVQILTSKNDGETDETGETGETAAHGALELSAAALAFRRKALAAAEELMARPAAERRRALSLMSAPSLASPHPLIAVRCRLTAASDLDGAHLAAALADEDPAPRAIALSRLAAAGALSEELWRRALSEADPALREAVTEAATPAALLSLLAGESDPWVRRAAGRALAGASRRKAASTPAQRAQISLQLAGDRDAWLRALGAELLDASEPAQRARLLELAADPSPMVQAAVIEQLIELGDDALAVEQSALAAQPAAADVPAVNIALGAWLAAATTPIASAASASIEERAVDAEDELRERAPSRGSSPSLPSLAELVANAGAGSPAAATGRRRLGRSGIEVAPLCISGAFDLSPGALHAAADAGVELFFWEPTYAQMARFLRGRSVRSRAKVMTGSYHADAASITLDVERALRRLRRDTLDLFLLFWARSPARLDEEAFAVLDDLKRAGKIRAAGFSTHDRALAMAALDLSPWDVVMTRHSAAHPGIEAELLPHAQARGASVITFSALCYGRMVSGPGAPSPADCYRYSLSQPGVTACISAPRRYRELVENLEVVANPWLDEAAMTALRRHGEGVRLENQRFGSLIRQPTRDAAAAAMALLEAELPPTEENEGGVDAVAASPRPSLSTRTAASLGRSLTSRDPSRRLRRGRL